MTVTKARLLLILGFFLLTCDPLVSEEPPINWLTIAEDVLEHWETRISPEKPSIMKVTPKWKQREMDVPKKVFGIVSKKSSSYILAATELLRVFHTEGIYADLTIINFGKDTKRGLQILRTAETHQADLIFSMGSESADLVHRHYTGGKIPVVTCTNKDPVMLGQIDDYEGGSGTNIAYTSLNVPIEIQKNYLFLLKPDLKNIGLLYNRNHAQVMATEVIPAQDIFEGIGVNLIDIAVGSRKTARKELRTRIPQAMEEMKKNDPDFINSVFWLTSSTAVFSNMDILTELCGQVPILSSIPNAVREGRDSAVIAIGIDRRNNAHQASIYAVKILKGEVKSGDLPVGIVTPPDVAVNFLIARDIQLKIPFSFFESAAFIYDYDGRLARAFGESVK